MTVVPPPTEDEMWKTPPSRATRSCMPVTPTPARHRPIDDEAASVIGHRDVDATIDHVHIHVSVVGAGVPRDIGQRFLDDAEARGLDFDGEPLVGRVRRMRTRL